MASLEELLQQAQSFNKIKQYQQVIDLLTDEVLEAHQSADLYAEQAQAYYRLGKKDFCELAADRALHINSNQAKANYYWGNIYLDLKQYDQAKIAYQKAIEINPDDAYAYIGLGVIYNTLKQYDQAKAAYQKAIEIDPEEAYSYFGLGNAYNVLFQFDQAEAAYQKAIEINPGFINPYLGLGIIYTTLKQYDQAKAAYQKAIEINPGFVNPYHGLGNLYHDLKQYDQAEAAYQKAIEISPGFAYSYHGIGKVYANLKQYDQAKTAFQKAIEIDPDDAFPYYSQGLLYEDIGDYKMALNKFEKYVELTKNNPNYYTTVALSKIEELKKLIKNSDYSKISELINKIKDLLLFKDPYVTHYTGISVAKLLILDGSQIRLSEGAYLNDTSEGRELFKFLPSLTEPTATNDTVALPFTPKPFIGSFVADTKHDDLTLWRMYGKENKEEAKGCAITLKKDELLKNLKIALIGDGKTDSPKIDDEEFSFYSVAYIESGKTQRFTVPGANDEVHKVLNGYMDDLAKKVKKFVTNKKKKEGDIPNLLELLNSIAYLFKTAEYSYEHELRLIVKGVGFEKKVDTYFTPPKVYVELVPIPPLIRKITLGPKVDRAEEWASAFYYKLDAEGHHPEIMISHLPFK